MAGRDLPSPLATVQGVLADSFTFDAPDSPGLHFRGGLADPARAGFAAGLPRISVAGSDLSEDGAEARCLGEAAERLSCLYDPGRGLESVPAADIPADLRALLPVDGETRRVPCLQGQSLGDGGAVWVPAALCLHNATHPPEQPRAVCAKGMAAGPDWQDAVARAVAELVERDAAALWWLGGRLAAPVSLDLLAAGEAAAVLHALRLGRRDRTVWLLDLSAGFGLITVAAVSVMESGEGFACGLGGDAEPAAAMRSALVEMAQMELSQHLIRGKAKALGPDGLTPADFRQIERSVRITPETCALILPSGPVRTQAANAGEPEGGPAGAIGGLLASGPLYAVDCTLPALDVPVAVVLAPGLQPFDPAVETPRLAAIRSVTGGGEQFHNGVALI